MTDKEVKVKNVAKTDSELARFQQESSLDNITQQKITEALESLTLHQNRCCTPTLNDPDMQPDISARKWKIAEDGTYSDLIKKDGIFKGLVEGQEV